MWHYRIIAKLDAYRNLQQHLAVIPAIALLSCYISSQINSGPIEHCLIEMHEDLKVKN